MENDKINKEIARRYSEKAVDSDSIDERVIAYEACLAGMKKQKRIDEEKMPEIIEKILDICLCDLSAAVDRNSHLEYINYRLNGGEWSEEDWFMNEV